MIKNIFSAIIIVAVCASLSSCGGSGKKGNDSDSTKKDTSAMQKKLDQFAEVELTTDLSKLTEKEKKMIPILIDIAKLMDDIFWMQTYGNKDSLLASIKDEKTKKFVEINYGPWERLNNNAEIIAGVGEKPKGANFYPKDMTKEEFEKFNDKNKTSLYTIIRRDEKGALKTIWYNEAFKEKIEQAAKLLKQAAELAEDAGLKKYFELRAKALLNDDYYESDMAWMDMKTNTIDFVVGPIENYEDGIYEYKTAQEAAILVKDKEWSKKLDKFIATLPELQQALPVDKKYKTEVPGSSSDLGVYDIIYYAGDANSGGKTIAINLPNDEKVQLKKGSRRLQLKNTMKAKFDNILMPIAKQLIDSSQLAYIKFDAFFNNTMFHEVGHGLGIKNTINGKGPVRTAMKDVSSAFEEAKADVLGLFLVTKLIEKKMITNITPEDNYATFMAGLIRSVRFGAAEAHGKANMMCFNYFEELGAFKFENGKYKVDFAKMKSAVDKWAEKILVFQGNGDYDNALTFLNKYGIVKPELQKCLDNLKTANIPVDVVFKQGVDVLGLK
ncbi:MAG TPA: Zn-dependent hydrolase [Bacteroidales bacterium]|nr:Zn-dependent hydrolase [Bacteroidales bacterium]HPS16136.1 Zn-dependent hydrolase [Bacteroidales bacterium]